MALSYRERLIAIGTGLAAVVFFGDRYALTPYLKARDEVAADVRVSGSKLHDATLRVTRARRMDQQLQEMLASGALKTDQSVAQFQVLDAIGDWAREAGVNLTSRTPQPETRNDATQIIRLRAAGTCSTAAAARLLWRVETAPIPLKVDELTLTTRKPGSDDLAINLVVSTIWVKPGDPADAKAPGAAGAAPRRPAPRDEGI
jgi:hypothetical protein